MDDRLLYIIGDVHGKFDTLNDCLDADIRRGDRVREAAEAAAARGNGLEVLVIQLGDFGILWPGRGVPDIRLGDMPHLAGGHAEMLFVPGNHENFDELDAIVRYGKPDARGLYPVPRVTRLWYAPFGTAFEVLPGVNALFIGKAASIDKAQRTLHVTWWPQEEADDADMARLPDTRIDWVFAHTAPGLWNMEAILGLGSAGFRDRTAMRLDSVLDRYRPERWFFGHWHRDRRGTFDGCAWRLLDSLSFLKVETRLLAGDAGLLGGPGDGRNICLCEP